MGSSTSDLPGERGQGVARAFGVPRVVVLLGVVSLLNDLSGEMITPLIPLFLVGALAAPVAVVGLVEGAADSTTALLKVWVGHRSDALSKRKPYIVGGYGLSAAAKPLLALSTVWPLALAARVVDRAGKGIRGAPRDAAIADATPPEILGRAFGVHRAFDTAGAIGGAVLALALIALFAGAAAATYGDFQKVFLVASIPGALSVALLVFGLREAQLHDGSRRASGSAPKGLVAAVRSLPAPVRRFLAVSGLFAFGNFTLGLFVLRVAEFAGGTAVALLSYIGFNVVATVVSFPAGVLADSRGRRPLVAAGLLLFVGAAVAFAFVSSFVEALLAFLLYGAFAGVWEASYRAYMSEICPRDLRGTALGAQGTVLAVLTLPGSAVAGVLWTAFGPQAAFLFGAAVGAGALLLFVGLRPAKVNAAAG